MKNLFIFFSKFFSKWNIENTSNKQKKAINNPHFPKNITELKELVENVYNEKRGAYKLLLEFVKSKESLSVKEMKAIYANLYRLDMTDELADAVCEKVIKETTSFNELTVGNLSFFLEKVGFYSIIRLFDYRFIKNGNKQEDSLKLLEEVRATTCWRHYENESAQRAYIYYFSFGDGKDLLHYLTSEKFLDIIKEYVGSRDARKMVKEGKMSKDLYNFLY